jgi:hypothetical protein
MGFADGVAILPRRLSLLTRVCTAIDLPLLDGRAADTWSNGLYLIYFQLVNQATDFCQLI